MCENNKEIIILVNFRNNLIIIAFFKLIEIKFISLPNFNQKILNIFAKFLENIQIGNFAIKCNSVSEGSHFTVNDY